MFRKKHTCTLLAVIILLSISATAQPLNWQWVRTTAGAGTEEIVATTTDALGNIYVAGNYDGASYTIGATTLTNPGTPHNHAFIACYNSSGSVVWATQPDCSGICLATAITADNSGGIYITGTYTGADITFGTHTLAGPGNNMFVARYSGSGSALWAERIIGMASDEPASLAADAGSVYLAGLCLSNILIAGTDTFRTSISNNAFVARFSNNGNLQWLKGSNTGDGGGHNGATAVAIGTDGHIYIAGFYDTDHFAYGNDTLWNDGLDVYKYFLLQLNADGSLNWSRQGGDAVIVEPVLLTTDGSGNVYMASEATGGAPWDSVMVFGTDTVSNLYQNAFLVKYNAAGAVQWAHNAGGITYVTVTGLTTDAADNIYMTGVAGSRVYFAGDSMDLGPHPDIYVFKFGSDGSETWLQHASGSEDDHSACIATDGAGNVYVAGKTNSNHVDFGSVGIDNPSATYNIFLAKLGQGVSGVAGVNPLPHDIILYPNPTISGNTVYIKTNKVADLHIYTTEGKDIYSDHINEGVAVIPLPKLPAGKYYIRIIGEESHISPLVITQ